MLLKQKLGSTLFSMVPRQKVLSSFHSLPEISPGVLISKKKDALPPSQI
jgi:hypothetical protein